MSGQLSGNDNFTADQIFAFLTGDDVLANIHATTLNNVIFLALQLSIQALSNEKNYLSTVGSF